MAFISCLATKMEQIMCRFEHEICSFANSEAPLTFVCNDTQLYDISVFIAIIAVLGTATNWLAWRAQLSSWLEQQAPFYLES